MINLTFNLHSSSVSPVKLSKSAAYAFLFEFRIYRREKVWKFQPSDTFKSWEWCWISLFFLPKCWFAFLHQPSIVSYHTGPKEFESRPANMNRWVLGSWRRWCLSQFQVQENFPFRERGVSAWETDDRFFVHAVRHQGWEDYKKRKNSITLIGPCTE